MHYIILRVALKRVCPPSKLLLSFVLTIFSLCCLCVCVCVCCLHMYVCICVCFVCVCVLCVYVCGFVHVHVCSGADIMIYFFLFFKNVNNYIYLSGVHYIIIRGVQDEITWGCFSGLSHRRTGWGGHTPPLIN